jgi:ABC-type branched-subunit amino acid transport system substrate-binding protein
MIAPVRQVLAAAALLLFGAAASGQGVTSRTVVLGQSAPLSGPRAALGEEIRNGALAYLRRLNDGGGVHGRRIELATLDDAGDPAKALANTRRFIEEFGVFALFAYPESSATREVLELAHRARMPLFAPLSGASSVRQPGRAVFTVRAGLADEAGQIVEHYSQLGLRRFALVRSDDAGGAQFLAALRAALSGRGQPPPLDAPIGAPGPGAAARKVAAAGVDVVIVALAQPPAGDAVRALRRAGTGAQIVATSAASADAMALALGADGAGVALSQVVPPLDRIGLPVVAEYRDAMEAESAGAAHSAASLEAFIAAKVIAEAIRRAGPALTRDSLLPALEAMSVLDTGGHTVRYSRSSRRGSDRIYLLAIGRDGALLH